MPKSVLDEREFELINIIGAQLASSQRDLSQHMELSLGMTNMLLKRLVSKGYIRIRQLNKRKMSYLLTPKGFAEKMRKSVKYTIKTINSISLVTEALHAIILKLYRDGERNFFVLGSSDLAALLEKVIKEEKLEGYRLEHINEMPEQEVDGTILLCREGVENGKANLRNRVDLIAELAKNEVLLAQG